MSRNPTWLRLGTFAVVVIVAWVLYISWKQIERNRRIEQEVSTLQAEEDKIRRENQTFNERIQYFSTSDFKEQEAKQKLGLKKTDETAVVITPEPGVEAASSSSPQTSADPSVNIDVPNYKKWWDLFSN